MFFFLLVRRAETNWSWREMVNIIDAFRTPVREISLSAHHATRFRSISSAQVQQALSRLPCACARPPMAASPHQGQRMVSFYFVRTMTPHIHASPDTRTLTCDQDIGPGVYRKGRKFLSRWRTDFMVDTCMTGVILLPFPLTAVGGHVVAAPAYLLGYYRPYELVLPCARDAPNRRVEQHAHGTARSSRTGLPRTSRRLRSCEWR